MSSMDYNTPDIRKSLIDDFPKLANDKKFVVVSPFTFEYNCIAWAIGMNDRWVDTSDIPWHWWPQGVRKDNTELALIEAFQYFGFERCDNGLSEDGYDKVALYSLNNTWQHAARVIDNETYHSKFGAYNDAYHGNGDVLDKTYGTIYQFMKRPIVERSRTDAFKGVRPGVIHTNYINPFANSYIAFYQKRIYDEKGREYELVNKKLYLKK